MTFCSHEVICGPKDGRYSEGQDGPRHRLPSGALGQAPLAIGGEHIEPLRRALA